LTPWTSNRQSHPLSGALSDKYNGSLQFVMILGRILFLLLKVADIIFSVSYQQGVCYAFVEFENSDSAQSAIEVLLLVDIEEFLKAFLSERRRVMIWEEP
jgi:hypothetical protein